MERRIYLTVAVLCTLLTSGCIFLGADEGAAPAMAEKTVQAKNTQADVPLAASGLQVYQEPEKYSYEDFLEDIQQVQTQRNNVRVEKLCETPDDRGIYDLIVGSGAKHIIIMGAMHAREYITAQLVMRQFCDAVDAHYGLGGFYRDVSKAELLQDVTLHFIPFANPDGIAISQFGFAALRDASLRQKAQAIGGESEQWKANGRGVDLNRNFDAGWIEFVGAGQPAAERYKGERPGSEPEAAALIKLTSQGNVCRTISYHTCGALIYWYYKQSGEVLEESRLFSDCIAEETGYAKDSDYTAVDAAGYKDWAVYKMGIPSITIEIGGETGEIINPVPMSRWQGIWQRNKDVVFATLYQLKKQTN